MPINPIPINKGVFKTQNQRNVRNTEFADNLINMFIDNAGGNYDRPTLDLYKTLGSGEPLGMYPFFGGLAVVTFDRNIYFIDSLGGVTNITGVSLPGSNRPRFADDGDSLYITGGEEPIQWGGVGNLTALIPGAPPNATHCVYLDGFLILNRRLEAENNKVIQWSGFEDTTSWPGINIFSAVSDPDEVEGLTSSQRELYVVGQDTCEIWQNVGTSPVPFSRSHIWQYGTRAPNSILSVDNSVIFLDQDKRFLRFSGRQFSRISEAIEEELSKYSTVDDCITSSFTWNGALYMLALFPTAGKAWSINLNDGQWSEWRGFKNGQWQRPRINCAVYDQTTNTSYAGDYSTGRIFQFSETTATDAGNTFVRSRSFSQRDLGGSVRKIANFVRINMRRDVANSYTGTIPETDPSFELRWKDDGKDWSKWRTIPIGKKGELRHYVEFHRLGIYRTRQYEWRISDPAKLNITSVETDEEVMAS